MKICKNCTNPCEDSMKFCVTCGSNEFISEEPGTAKNLEDIAEDPVDEDPWLVEPPAADEPEMIEEPPAAEEPELIEEPPAAEEPTLAEAPPVDDIFREDNSEVEQFEIIEASKREPAAKWPIWVKAAMFMMSASILIIAVVLFFWVVVYDEPEPDIPDAGLVAVPTNLVGATDSSAQAVLESLGFVVVVERVYHDDVAAGAVIAQNPQTGMLHSGESVRLYVSLGRESVLMPDLVGMTREEATIVLARMNIGFFFRSEGEYSESIAFDNVIRQHPPSGTELFESSHITFSVSLGPQPEEAPISLPRFAINYIANGGLGTMSPILVDQGSNHIVLASQFTRSGFAFDGWNTMPDGSGMQFAPGLVINAVLGDINLFAQWQDTHVTISYHANGGMGHMADVVVLRYQSHILMASGFTRAGYNFVSWNTIPNGSGRSYMPNQTMANLQDNVTLYAQWQTAHTALTHISNVPTSGRVNVSLNLTGTAMPHNATVRSPIHWSVISGEGVSISGNVLIVSQAGNVTVRATVPNGRAAGSDFIQDFTIAIAGDLPSIIAPAGGVGEYGIADRVQLSFTGSPTSFSLSGNVPFGVTVTNTGVVSWTTATPAGVYDFYITAINQHGSSAAHRFTLIIGMPLTEES